MPHDRWTVTEQEARHQLRIARERSGRAAALECSLAELDTLDAAIARATDGWSRDRRVALALRVQKEARQAGDCQAAFDRTRGQVLADLVAWVRITGTPPRLGLSSTSRHRRRHGVVRRARAARRVGCLAAKVVARIAVRVASSWIAASGMSLLDWSMKAGI